jgi:hypothetical protein
MCKKCGLPASVNMQSLTALRRKAIAAEKTRFTAFEEALSACLLAKARYEAADRAYSARGETASPEAAEYQDALDLYKINSLLLEHASRVYQNGGGA